MGVEHAKPLLDGGSLLYFGAGLAGGLTSLPWWGVLGLGVAAKVVTHKLSKDETLPGTVVDLGALMSGYGVVVGVRDLGLLRKFGFGPSQYAMEAA